jgi:hypothetical protein
VAELLSIVIWWIATALIGVALGSLAAVLGLGWPTALGGAVALLIAGVFVFGSVLANNTSQLRRSNQVDVGENEPNAGLAGAGLLRATLLGFLGAGLIVGSLSGSGITAIVAGATAVGAILLIANEGSIRDRTLR